MLTLEINLNRERSPGLMKERWTGLLLAASLLELCIGNSPL